MRQNTNLRDSSNEQSSSPTCKSSERPEGNTELGAMDKASVAPNTKGGGLP